MKHCFTATLSLFVVLLCFMGCKKDEQIADKPLKLLHATKGANPGIYDTDGRYVLLRGANFNALGDYWQGDASAAPTLNYSAENFKQMAASGFNCVRLLFHWSKLMPQKGVISQAYIQQLKLAIEDAAKYNIYVVLDMHQDAYSKYIATPSPSLCTVPAKGWDGAPQWATMTDGESTCTTDGSRESAPAVYHAAHNFWGNTNGIQDECISAWTELVKQTCGYPNLAGYDMLNEPNMGYGTLYEEKDKLDAYYTKLFAAIRNAEAASGNGTHIIFFEMAVTVAGAPNPIFPSITFATDDNVVFSPHHYFESISYGASIEDGYNALHFSNNTFYKTAMWMGEWGYFGGVSDTSKIRRFGAVEDSLFCGSTWWQWSQAPGDPHSVQWNGVAYEASATGMALVEVNKGGTQTGAMNDAFLQVLSRSRPLAIAGQPKKLRSNPHTGAMYLEASLSSEGQTELWIPDRFGSPKISGSNVQSFTLDKVDGGYRATLNVKGDYTAVVGF